MSGKFVSVNAAGDSVTLSHGGNKPNTDHKVGPSATVTLDGSASTLADLRSGDDIVLVGDPATKVTATRPGP